MGAKKISISVGKAQLATAKRIAKREGLSLSAVFVRGLERELEAEERRRALSQLVRDFPPISAKRKGEIRASWGRGLGRDELGPLERAHRVRYGGVHRG